MERDKEREGVREGGRNSQDEIHLVNSEPPGLGHEEKGPGGGDEHPGGEEEPGAVAEGGEDVGEGLCDGELDGPVGALGEVHWVGRGDIE